MLRQDRSYFEVTGHALAGQEYFEVAGHALAGQEYFEVAGHALAGQEYFEVAGHASAGQEYFEVAGHASAGQVIFRGGRSCFGRTGHASREQNILYHPSSRTDVRDLKNPNSKKDFNHEQNILCLLNNKLEQQSVIHRRNQQFRTSTLRA